MSIFDRIKSKIFGTAQAAEPAPGATAAPSAAPGAGSGTTSVTAPQAPEPARTGSGASGAGPAAAPAAPAPSTTPAPQPTSTPASTPVGASAQDVDVEAILTEKAKGAGQSLDWRRSIVDLLKLLDLDSSLSARKELAGELNYTGDTNDSATMNVWLHRQVMKKLAENGGKVPAELKD